MEVFLIIFIVSILVTCLLNYVFKTKRYIKYIPSIIILPIMIYYFITTYTVPSEGFESLGRFVMGLLLLAAFLPSLVCAVVIDIVHKSNVKKRDNQDRMGY